MASIRFTPVFSKFFFVPPGARLQLSPLANSNVAFGTSSSFIRSTCPSHFSLRVFIVCEMSAGVVKFGGRLDCDDNYS